MGRIQERSDAAPAMGLSQERADDAGTAFRSVRLLSIPGVFCAFRRQMHLGVQRRMRPRNTQKTRNGGGLTTDVFFKNRTHQIRGTFAGRGSHLSVV